MSVCMYWQAYIAECVCMCGLVKPACQTLLCNSHHFVAEHKPPDNSPVQASSSFMCKGSLRWVHQRVAFIPVPLYHTTNPVRMLSRVNLMVCGADWSVQRKALLDHTLNTPLARVSEVCSYLHARLPKQRTECTHVTLLLELLTCTHGVEPHAAMCLALIQAVTLAGASSAMHGPK